MLNIICLGTFTNPEPNVVSQGSLDLQRGDLLLVFVANPESATVTAPSEFTQIEANNCLAYSHYYAVGDPTEYTFTSSATSSNLAVALVVYRYAGQIVTASTNQTQTIPQTFSSTTYTTTSSTSDAVDQGQNLIYPVGDTPPSGYSTVDGNTTTNYFWYMYGGETQYQDIVGGMNDPTNVLLYELFARNTTTVTTPVTTTTTYYTYQITSPSVVNSDNTFGVIAIAGPLPGATQTSYSTTSSPTQTGTEVQWNQVGQPVITIETIDIGPPAWADVHSSTVPVNNQYTTTDSYGVVNRTWEASDGMHQNVTITSYTRTYVGTVVPVYAASMSEGVELSGLSTTLRATTTSNLSSYYAIQVYDTNMEVPNGITSATFNLGGPDPWSGATVVSLTPVSPPNPPILQFPTNNAIVNGEAGIYFTGIAQSTDAGYIDARVLRVKQEGGVVYSYWNQATASLQATVVWNPVNINSGDSGSLGPITFANGQTEVWSMADQESIAGLQGDFAADFTVEFAALYAIGTIAGSTVVSGTATVTPPILGSGALSSSGIATGSGFVQLLGFDAPITASFALVGSGIIKPPYLATGNIYAVTEAIGTAKYFIFGSGVIQSQLDPFIDGVLSHLIIYPAGTISGNLIASGTASITGVLALQETSMTPIWGVEYVMVAASFLAKTIGRTITSVLSWYDQESNLLGSNTIYTEDNPTSWTHISQYFVTPSQAYYARLQVFIGDLKVGESHYMRGTADFPLTSNYSGILGVAKVDFASQLAAHCEDAFSNTGALRMGLIGTRIGVPLTQVDVDAISDDLRLLDMGDMGKYIGVFVGEGTFNFNEMPSAYIAEAIGSIAAVMATVDVRRSISYVPLPNFQFLGSLNTAQVAQLANSHANPIMLTTAGERGTPFQSIVATDNTLGPTGTDYWSFMTLRLISTIIDYLRTLGNQSIGTLGYSQFQASCSNFLTSLVNQTYIQSFTINFSRSTPNGAITVTVGITPWLALRQVFFTATVGPGS